MKIVIDMDMPENCAECPCGFIYVVEYTIKHCCAVIDKNIDDENIKPPWCPIVGEIEQEQKTGHWILLDECANGGHYCSECRKKVVKEGWSSTVKKITYCPNCGARMVGSGDKE